MPLILIILSLANLTLAIIAFLPSLLNPKTANSKEFGSIALSSTKNRKLYALLLGLTSCIILAFFSPKDDPLGTLILLSSGITNILTIVISYVTQLKLRKNLRQTHAHQSIAVIKLEGITPTPIELWLKKSNQEWPPINLEIGMGPWVVVANCLNKPLLEQIRSVFKQSKLINEIDLQKNLKQILNDNGVTHPMDIEGSSCIPEVKEFFEKTLIVVG